jgi:hypothetical protein
MVTTEFSDSEHEIRDASKPTNNSLVRKEDTLTSLLTPGNALEK